MTTWQRSHRYAICVILGKNALLPTLNKQICTCLLNVGYLNDVPGVKTQGRLTMWQARYMIPHPTPLGPANANFVTCMPILLFNNHGSECGNSDIPCIARQPEYYNKNNLGLGSLGGVAGDSGCPGCDTASLGEWHPTFRRT